MASGGSSAPRTRPVCRRTRYSAPPGLAAVNERDDVLDLQAAQRRGQRWLREQFHLEEPPWLAGPGFVLAQDRLVLPLHAQPGHAGVGRTGLRTGDPEPGLDGPL